MAQAPSLSDRVLRFVGKDVKPAAGVTSSVGVPKIDDANTARLTFAMTAALPGSTGLAAYKVRPTCCPPSE
nr:hypothetical protein [Streptomyces umbrinus]